MTGQRSSDLVVHGATGFVGRRVARYLAHRAPAGTRVTLSGRDPAALEAVRAGLGERAAGWPLVVADSTDRAAMDRLAASTRAVASTVGPYARYGRELVLACAAAGTHYADLSGEVLFVRDSIAGASAAAAASGARIVHACGYDAVPSDLAVLLLHTEAAGAGLTDTVLVARARGGLSGGTVDSLRAQLDAVRADPSLRRVLADPYSLSPDPAGEPVVGPQPDAFGPRRDPLLGEWSVPSVMGPFDTRIVRRSNALMGWAYGRDFRYREVMTFGRRPDGAAAAAAVAGGMGGLLAAMRFGPSRWVLDRALPAPGAGPSEAALRRGWFRSEVHSRLGDGRRLRAVVAGAGDPGYEATAVMLGECALALALDAHLLPPRAGVLTPATAFGTLLVERLRAAGMRLEVGSGT